MSRPQRKSVAVRLLGVVLALSLGSCVHLKPETLLTTSDYQPASVEDVTAVTSYLRASVSAVTSFRAMGDLLILKSGKRYRGTQVVVFTRPDKLRLELFSTALNRLTSIIVCRNGELTTVDFEAKQAYQGMASERNLARLTGIPLSVEQIMLLNTGRIAVSDRELENANVFRELDSGKLVVLVRDDNGRIFHLILRRLGDVQSELVFELEAVKVFDGNTELLFIEYLKQTPSTTVRQISPTIPPRIRVMVYEEDLELELSYEQADLNPVIAPDEADRLYSITLPPGMPVKKLH